jgi:lysophospholipase L1-like esterase
VYSALLEQSINAGPEGRRVEVVNAGLSGANIDRAMDRLELANGAYRADLLIYGFTINDIEGEWYREVPREGAAARGAVRQNPFASSRSALLRMLFWKWLSWRHGGTKPADTWYARELRQNYFDNPDAWQHLLAGLDRFAALAAREGVCAQVFIHTHLTDLGPEHPYLEIYDRVEAAAAERGLPVRSAYAAHAGLHAPRLWVGFFDPHPNPAGHQVLASDLEQALTLLPERCWRGRAAAPTRPQ